MKKALLTTALAAMTSLSGCDSLQDDRIPSVSVYIPFSTQATWELYGATAAGDYCMFIREQRIPSNFPWTEATLTGFGGVLLVCDYYGEPQAFDLACPVERQYDVRLKINTDDMFAHCPKCGSVYQVFSNYGAPVSGTAAKEGYSLRRYSVGRGTTQYMIITRY
jgi:hypothetical protein